MTGSRKGLYGFAKKIRFKDSSINDANEIVV